MLRKRCLRPTRCWCRSSISASSPTPGSDNSDLSAFVLKQCTGGPLPVEVKQALITSWPGRFLEVYGLTEGGCTVILDATATPTSSPLSDGRRPALTSASSTSAATGSPRGETGEIVGRSGLMMTGYYSRPEDTEALRWRDREGNVFFRSGDLGAFDADGFLQIMGRKKDVVISGGLQHLCVGPRNRAARGIRLSARRP